MEFLISDLVWFIPPVPPNPGAGTGTTNQYLFIPGKVVETHNKAGGNFLTIESVDDEFPGLFTLEYNGSNIRKRNGTALEFEDMIQMNDLSSPYPLLYNLHLRYSKGLIYTYIGSILIAVNPYKMYDIYGQNNVKLYEGNVLGELPPHLFAIGSAAYNKMIKEKAAQVVVISGESGSGKTESTKLILGYLALVNKSTSNLITEQILEASPLLESFGNAKTSKNDNSSRFGKYLQIYFDGPTITGARITEYLLEKSRIVTQSPEERNYHIFYQLLRGLSKEQKELYGLTSAEKYFYLNQGGNCGLDSDGNDFNNLMSAFQILGFGGEEIDIILRILAGVLHLGNVYFHRKQLKHGQEGVEIGSDAEIQWISHLLQLHPEGIRKCLTTKITETRRDRLTTPLTIDQSLDSRDAIAKVLYSSLFTWLVTRINRIIFKGESKLAINILDIFGFEDFKENSFEQLCINYANESLQHYLNKHIFKFEQQEYAKEKIDWVHIQYDDNLGVINLLSKKPIGILHLLDDESNFPKGTDTSFLEKSHYNHALNESYTRPRMNCNEFGIKHYAGPVMYNVEGFLEKNRDTLRIDVVKLLAGSGNTILSKIFTQQLSLTQHHHHHHNTPGSSKSSPASDPNSRLFLTVKPRAPTVAARFHDSLQTLLCNMSKCSPWFIRCFKPNDTKTPTQFNSALVLQQLKYSGLLETIKIRKHGYPRRILYSDFIHRYKCLIRGKDRLIAHCDLNLMTNRRQVIGQIIFSATGAIENENGHPIPPDSFQLGLTKVFLRESLEQQLEKYLLRLYNQSSTLIQTTVRAYLARKRYEKLKETVISLQSKWRMKRQRNDFKRRKAAAQTIQKSWRICKERRAKERLLQMNKSRENSRNGCIISGINYLEIPPELAFIYSKLNDFHPIHTERLHITKLIGPVHKTNNKTLLTIPSEVESSPLAKYSREQIKNQILGMKREPISVPFLTHSEVEESVMGFKLILRYMNDPSLHNGPLSPNTTSGGQNSQSQQSASQTQTGNLRSTALVHYLIKSCNSISNNRGSNLADEFLVQTLNQTINNPNNENRDRGYLLLLHLLSSVIPSKSLWKTLLNYFSYEMAQDESIDPNSYQHLIQLKLLSLQWQTLPRFYSPTLLEYRTNKARSNSSLTVYYYDNEYTNVEINSWTTIDELAQEAADIKLNGSRHDNRRDSPERGVNVSTFGWTLELLPEGVEVKGYVNDVIWGVENRGGIGEILGGLEYYENYCYLFGRQGVRVDSTTVQQQVTKSKSLDHLDTYGLSSGSKLNSRYYKGESTGHLPSMGGGRRSRSSFSDDEDVEEEDLILPTTAGSVISEYDDDEEIMMLDGGSEITKGGSVSASMSASMGGGHGHHNRAGPPRYIKSTSKRSSATGNMSTTGSYSSRAVIERGGGNGGHHHLSSAMSDTSETPSLASHVRRVRVPSQASDVEQFLDDLFDPVLDINIDEMSDVRSVVQSIRGGGPGAGADSSPTKFFSPNNHTHDNFNVQRAFIQSTLEQNIQIHQQLIAQNNALQMLLKQHSEEGGTVPQELLAPMSSSSTKFVPNFVPPPPPSHAPPPPAPPSSSAWTGADRSEGTYYIPPPPPLPPCPLEGSRPFIDPYGRAKTVRIGKWRWPPANGGGPNDNFQDFKIRQESKANIENSNEHGYGQQPPIPNIPAPEPPKQPAMSKLKAPFTAAEPHIGKLKISSEMRMKLEQVHSKGQGQTNGVNGTSGEETVIRKIDSDRKFLLAEKLGHHAHAPQHRGPPASIAPSSSSIGPFIPPPPPPAVAPANNNSRHANHHGHHQQHQHQQQIHQQPKAPLTLKTSTGPKSTLVQPNLHAPFYTYNRVPWAFRLRKEVFHPLEEELSPIATNLIFLQILSDISSTSSSGSFRLKTTEKSALLKLLHDSNFPISSPINPTSLTQIAKWTQKKFIIEEAKKWEFYFSKIWNVESSNESKFLSANSNCLKLLKKSYNHAHNPELETVETLHYSNVSSVYSNGNKLEIHGKNNGRVYVFYSERSNEISEMLNNGFLRYFYEAQQQLQMQHQHHNGAGNHSPHAQHHHQLQQHNNKIHHSIHSPSSSSHVHHERSTSLPVSINEGSSMTSRDMSAVGGAGQGQHGNQPGHLSSTDGKHSLLQFAMEYFRKEKFNLSQAQQQQQSNNSNSQWNWSSQMSLVKHSSVPLETSLLPLDDTNNLLALDIFRSIMKYMGDIVEAPRNNRGGGGSNLGNSNTEVEAVYTILRNTHTTSLYPHQANNPQLATPLHDELYAQLMKQTTSNPNSKSLQRGWRLFTIISAYFTCTENLRPYLFKYLESIAYDKRRAYHGTALVALQNLRKTFKYGGRRNVPSVEEITAISAGRNAKRQIFRMPGGNQRVLNIKGSTVVKDVIEEMCGLLNIVNPEEREEFSIYCIVEGDTFTMPLMKEEYILDVTTELYKNEQIFYLIFCRSVWYFPLKFDSEPYIEVVFNQVAPDYLEGLLLIMSQTGQLISDDVPTIALIGALLHRAADLITPPTLKETKYLLPKPALASREIKPGTWHELVLENWEFARNFTSSNKAKGRVLEILQTWKLFGSSFFSVRKIHESNPIIEDYILALNKNGVHFLDPVTHVPLSTSPYHEILSTRKVKNEEGILYLDLKFGNLMQTRITRIQTEHAHEISRLIRMYIGIKKGGSGGGGGTSSGIGGGAGSSISNGGGSSSILNGHHGHHGME